MLRSSRNQDSAGVYSSNNDTLRGNATQSSSRKRKRYENEQNEINEGTSRKRQTVSRVATENVRIPRDESQPGPSRNRPTTSRIRPVTPMPVSSIKTTSELCGCNGPCSMPLILNPSSTMSQSGLNNLHFPPTIYGISARSGPAMGHAAPSFSECQVLPMTPACQNSLTYSSGITTRRSHGSSSSSLVGNSLPSAIPQFVDRNNHPPCLLCCPSRTLPQNILPYPGADVPTVRRVDPMAHSSAMSGRSSFPVNHSNLPVQDHHHHHHHHQLPPLRHVHEQREVPFHLFASSRAELPNILSLGQFPTNVFSDVNGNTIPHPPRVPFREIEPYNMAMRNTRSLSNRQHPLGNFTEAMSRFSESWMERYPGSDVENAFVLMPQQVSPDFRLLPSFDVQNYEALLGLAQQLADSKPKGLSKNELDQLPIFHFNPEHNQSTITNCVVCMNEFESRQRIRTLRCKHQFHSKCVDKWLKTNRTCPMCRADAMEAKKTPKKKKSRDH